MSGTIAFRDEGSKEVAALNHTVAGPRLVVGMRVWADRMDVDDGSTTVCAVVEHAGEPGTAAIVVDEEGHRWSVLHEDLTIFPYDPDVD